MVKDVVSSERARQDVQEAFHFYRRRQGLDEARAFRRELKEICRRIGVDPKIGDRHFARKLNLPGLYYRRLETYPYLVFYVERAERIEVWRVLHEHSDIPTSLWDVC
jgi:toxin ParE1/3/4